MITMNTNTHTQRVEKIGTHILMLTDINLKKKHKKNDFVDLLLYYLSQYFMEVCFEQLVKRSKKKDKTTILFNYSCQL